MKYERYKILDLIPVNEFINLYSTNLLPDL